MLSSFLLLCLVSRLPLVLADLWPEESFAYTAADVPVFKTEPTFETVVLKILNKTQDPSRLEPGFLFIAPHVFHLGYGPHIFTQDGQLVWYGQDIVGRFGNHIAQAMDFMPCNWRGPPGTHFCFSEGRPKRRDLDPARRTGGLNRVFDNTYKQVGKDILKVGGFDPPNPHEFTVTQDDSFLQAIFHKRAMDLRPYRGPRKGWVYEPCFQEARLRSKKQLFRWCYLWHHPVWQTDIFLRNKHNKVNKSTPIGGRGIVRDPWDFAHLNALDKNTEGDYLVSLRHLDQVLKIAGNDNVHNVTPGTTLWRLGGHGGDIKFDSHDAKFSRQHHVRFVDTTDTETVFSVFDNAFDGTYNSSAYSAAKIIAVNNQTRTARLVKEYPHPYKRLSASQGSTQVFANGNVFVGWGARPQLTEFADDGTLLYHAQILPDPGNMTNYRSFKGHWIGRPFESSLKLVPYCKSCKTFVRDSTGDPLYAYVSWNGATDVAKWRFHLSASSPLGPWIPAGTVEKTRFETRAKLESKAFAHVASFAPWVSVQALDQDGVIIGTRIARTFVPDTHLEDKCNETECFEPQRFLYSEDQSRGITCQISLVPMSTVLLILCCFIEAGIFFLNAALQRASSPRWNASLARRQIMTETAAKRRRFGSIILPGLANYRDFARSHFTSPALALSDSPKDDAAKAKHRLN